MWAVGHLVIFRMLVGMVLRRSLWLITLWGLGDGDRMDVRSRHVRALRVSDNPLHDRSSGRQLIEPRVVGWRTADVVHGFMHGISQRLLV